MRNWALLYWSSNPSICALSGREGNADSCHRKATTFSRTDARLFILNRGFPSPRPLWGKIFLPATAAGGRHAKWECRTTKPQEALGYLAISLVGENIRRKENRSTEANRNG